MHQVRAVANSSQTLTLGGQEGVEVQLDVVVLAEAKELASEVGSLLYVSAYMHPYKAPKQPCTLDLQQWSCVGSVSFACRRKLLLLENATYLGATAMLCDDVRQWLNHYIVQQNHHLPKRPLYSWKQFCATTLMYLVDAAMQRPMSWQA